MKLTLQEIQELKVNIKKALKDYPKSFRRGQVLFNYLPDEVYKKYLVTDKDCFYKDENIPKLIEEVIPEEAQEKFTKFIYGLEGIKKV